MNTLFRHSTLGAVIALLVAMLSIQSGAALAKHLFPLIGSQATTAMRLLFASFMLLAVFKPWRYPINRVQWGSILLYGASLGSMNLLFYMALARIPLGIAVAIEFIGPLGVALYYSRKAKDFLWVLCAGLGIILLQPFMGSAAKLDFTGMVYALLAGVCWGLYIIFGKRAGMSVNGRATTAFGMCIAACLTVPIGLAEANSSIFSFYVIGMGFAVALFSSALPYSLEMIALRKLPAKTFSLMTSLEPALGVVSGWIFLSETLSLIQCVAITLIVFTG
jgi:inner membrane transporter RhtA